MFRSAFTVVCAAVGAAFALNACADASTASDLFGNPASGGRESGSRGGSSGDSEAGGALGGSSTPTGGRAAAGESAESEGGTGMSSEGGAPENEKAGSGSGAKGSSQGGRAAAGSSGTAGKTASGGSAGKAGSGGAPGSSGSSGKAGSSDNAGQAGVAETGGVAGAGGEATEGGGSGDGAGEAGKPPVLDCNALEREARSRLEQAQACRPGVAPPASCTGFVQNECDCPVIVDDPESVEAKQYVEAVTALRKRCAVLCLSLVCPTSVRGECSASGPGPARCVAEGLEAEGPPTPSQF